MRDITRTPWSLFAAAILTVATIGLIGCGVSDGDREPITTEEEGEEPVDVGHQEAEMALEQVKLGTRLGPDGAIDVEHQTTVFPVGTPARVAFELDPESPATEVEVVWYGPDGLEVDSDTAVVEPDQRYADFSIDTAVLGPGLHRGEVWYGNELVEEFQFEIVAAEDGAGGAANGQQ